MSFPLSEYTNNEVGWGVAPEPGPLGEATSSSPTETLYGWFQGGLLQQDEDGGRKDHWKEGKTRGGAVGKLMGKVGEGEERGS